MRREYSARAVPRGTAGEAGPECHVPTHLRYFLPYLTYPWESEADDFQLLRPNREVMKRGPEDGLDLHASSMKIEIPQ